MTSATTPWRQRAHIGITIRGRDPRPREDPIEPGPPGELRDWPSFSAAVFAVDGGVLAIVVGPSWPDRPAPVERWRLRVPPAGYSKLLERIRDRVDARQEAWWRWSVSHVYERIPSHQERLEAHIAECAALDSPPLAASDDRDQYPELAVSTPLAASEGGRSDAQA